MPTHVTIRGVDPTTWREFRAACVKQGLPLGPTLTTVIREWLARQEEQAQ